MAVERSQKIEKLSTEFRAKVGQSSPKAKFQTPISPPNGGRFSPNKNHFSQDCQHYKRHGSAGGCRPPKGVNPKVPHLQFSTPHFFETPWSDFSQKLMGGDRISEVCKFVIWSRSDDRKWPNRLHSFWGFSGLGAKPHPTAGN